MILRKISLIFLIAALVGCVTTPPSLDAMIDGWFGKDGVTDDPFSYKAITSVRNMATQEVFISPERHRLSLFCATLGPETKVVDHISVLQCVDKLGNPLITVVSHIRNAKDLKLTVIDYDFYKGEEINKAIQYDKDRAASMKLFAMSMGADKKVVYASREAWMAHELNK